MVKMRFSSLTNRRRLVLFRFLKGTISDAGKEDIVIFFDMKINYALLARGIDYKNVNRASIIRVCGSTYLLIVPL